MTSTFYYEHTHESTSDGSPAMLVAVSPDGKTYVLCNEDGYEWQAYSDEWKPIGEPPTDFDMGWDKAGE